jgi:hypothetical protein
LLDANVVIELFSLRRWDAVVSQFEIHLSEAVVKEADFYEDSAGNLHDIDLSSYIDQRKVQVFSHSLADLDTFRNRFDPIYFEKLDPGETESLIHLLSLESEEYCICSSDGIVFRVLGNLRLSHLGVSLEEVLNQLGIQCPLEPQFTKESREKWRQDGFADSLFGRGLKD